MEKRFILAIALSLLILLSWSAFISKSSHLVDTKEVKEKLPPPPTPSPTLELPEQKPLSSINLSQEKFEMIFTEPQAAVNEVIYRDYQSYKFVLQNGFLLGDKSLVFKPESITSNSATFSYADQNKKIIKRFIFRKSNYYIELEIEMENLSDVPHYINLPLVLGVLNFATDRMQARFQDVTVALPDKVLHLNGRKEVSFEKIRFLGLRDRYFCAIIEPDSDNWGGFIKRVNHQESTIGLSPKEFVLNPSQHTIQRFHIYLGPQELQHISRIKPEWSAVIYFGVFNFIAHLLLHVLNFLFGLAKNWGLAIVILSILIYIVLFPLTLKQMRSMKHMQALQPAIEELRKTYKDNPQKLNKEIMELYRFHKANPFSGCLPLLLQIPIFFSLYQVLMRSVVLKGAHFLWIKDLSGPDRLFILPMSLPVLGNEINILPILMTIGMFFQQKSSIGAARSGSSEQQRLMSIIFPLMFGVIFYHMPAGLVLYWFTNSLFTLIYQFRINRAK